MFANSRAYKATSDSATHELLPWDDARQQKRKWVERPAKASRAEPQTVKKWDFSRVMSILLDVVLLGLALVFAAFGIAVKRWEGSSIDSSTYKLLARAAKLAPTIFPILFAAIVGRALKAIALWRLEKGSEIGFLDQLVGSTSITTTVTTQFKLRALNFVSLALIGIWALSPLGGQGSIRILETTTANTNTSTIMQFLNLSSNALNSYYAGADTAGSFTLSNSLFAAALSSPVATKRSGVDTWGNVKIPVLELMNASAADAEGWIVSNPAEVTYASLIGLPFSEVTANNKTTFTFETNYWHLDCPSLLEIESPIGPCNITGWSLADGSSESSIPGMFLSSSPRVQSNVWNSSDTDCRQLAYCGWDSDNSNSTAANCTMTNSYVEAEIECNGQSCGASRVRRSRTTPPSTCWTPLDSVGPDYLWYASELVSALGSFHEASVTPFQGYLVQPDNPFNTSALEPVYTLSNVVFATRLAQILNTYWYAILGAQSVQTGVSNSNLNQTATANGATVGTTPGTITTSRTVIACNSAWLIILLLSVLILVAMSVAGIVATALSTAPDLSFNISSMVKESPYVTVPTGGSALPAGDRSRLLKHVRVQYGDVDGDEDVGTIAIATPRGTVSPAAIRKDRLYA